jgi:hypothetical protein
MKARADISDIDRGMKALERRLREGPSHVDIGIHADAGDLLVKIAAAHEFGANIDHPGGTAYGYKTQADQKARKVTFLKGGAGYKILGRTKPHKIKIPMRSYIRSTIDENVESYHDMAERLTRRIGSGEIDKLAALQLAGQKIESDIKRKITKGPFTPLRPATIARKKSDKPLIDKGILRSSVRYVVKYPEKSEEKAG